MDKPDDRPKQIVITKLHKCAMCEEPAVYSVIYKDPMTGPLHYHKMTDSQKGAAHMPVWPAQFTCAEHLLAVVRNMTTEG